MSWLMCKCMRRLAPQRVRVCGAKAPPRCTHRVSMCVRQKAPGLRHLCALSSPWPLKEPRDLSCCHDWGGSLDTWLLSKQRSCIGGRELSPSELPPLHLKMPCWRKTPPYRAQVGAQVLQAPRRRGDSLSCSTRTRHMHAGSTNRRLHAKRANLQARRVSTQRGV